MNVTSLPSTASPAAPDFALGREWFSPAEVAAMTGRAAYIVREYCRLQRIQARKRQCGRGRSLAWEIHRSEVVRLLDHGLLPDCYSRSGPSQVSFTTDR